MRPGIRISEGKNDEGNEATADPFAYASAARSAEGAEVEFASPLLGGYTAAPGASLPEPAAVGALAVAGLLSGRRRKR